MKVVGWVLVSILAVAFLPQRPFHAHVKFGHVDHAGPSRDQRAECGVRGIRDHGYSVPVTRVQTGVDGRSGQGRAQRTVQEGIAIAGRGSPRSVGNNNDIT